jgi:hypothetical protein
MALGYDLFRRLDNESVVWVGAVATLDDATKQLEELAVSKPARYFVRDAITAKVVRETGPGTSTMRRP